MRKFLTSLPVRLILGLIIGIVIGLYANSQVAEVMVTVRNLLGELIMFTIPLVIIGFITPAINRLGGNASKLLGLALIIAYVSSIGASFFAQFAGYAIVPHLNIVSNVAGTRELPEQLFKLSIPQIMPVMSSLVIAVLVGLAAAWTKAKVIGEMLDEFQSIIIQIVTKVIIPLLPFYIGCTFACLAFEGSITRQLPVFLIVILLAMLGHYIWLALLYGIAGAYSGRNPLKVLRNYGPAYLTAVGTMSSAATLPVALRCANKSAVLRKDMVAFGVPLFANVHLCGSVLTETLFILVISQMIYGHMPSQETMILFTLLLGIFAIAAPGVPGGTVMASLGLVTSVIGFDNNGTALLLTIFALQDSFGTACNVTGDGALTLILTGYCEKHHLPEQEMTVNI
jgi:Na+/H+-dicarboxylate symporter